MNAVPMLIRCTIGQQERNNIREPDHGCGTPASDARDSREVLPADQEGVIAGYHPLGAFAGDTPNYGYGD